MILNLELWFNLEGAIFYSVQNTKVYIIQQHGSVMVSHDQTEINKNINIKTKKTYDISWKHMYCIMAICSFGVHSCIIHA